jgi:hypothetical protein
MGTAHSNHEREERERVLMAGRPNYYRCDNKIITAKYTVWNFLPIVSGHERTRGINSNQCY